eukprot:538063_1
MMSEANDLSRPGKCNCFGNDKHIKCKNVIRYTTITWTWTSYHDTALAKSISTYFHVPKEIACLIKQHAFHESQQWTVLNPLICREKCYSNNNQLLQKSICKHWYNNMTYYMIDPINIALHVDICEVSDNIFECLSQRSLPSLHMRSNNNNSKYKQIIRRLHIDKHKFRLHVTSFNSNQNNNNILCSHGINMIVLNETDSTQRTNIICQKIWSARKTMKNCIMVKIRKHFKRKLSQNSKTIDQLAAYHNIPCISVCFNKSQTIMNLFCFAVKYHWFCEVIDL